MRGRNICFLIDDFLYGWRTESSVSRDALETLRPAAEYYYLFFPTHTDVVLEGFSYESAPLFVVLRTFDECKLKKKIWHKFEAELENSFMLVDASYFARITFKTIGCIWHCQYFK